MRVLRFLSSYQLSCGCLVGVYELYNGEIASIVDEPIGACADPTHKTGQRLKADTDTSASGPHAANSSVQT